MQYIIRSNFLFLALVTPAIAVAQPSDLQGAAIEFEAGSYERLHVPLALPYAGSVPEGQVVVREPTTGESFPAQVYEGRLVFISEGALADTFHNYVVEINDDTEGIEPVVQLRPREGENAVEVFVEDALLTTYIYGEDLKKPYLWPVLSQDAEPVTRSFPMSEEGIPRFAKDHPHHRSMWTAYGDINGVDFWLENDRAGVQRVKDVTYGDGDAFGWLRSDNTWEDTDGTPIIDELREYHFYGTPEAQRLIDVVVSFTASYGDAKFGDTKEGGMVAVRMRPEISYGRANITNALGDFGESGCWGKPSPWCDYSAELSEAGWRGLAVFDHPENFRHPTSWHVRQYGLMGANCFGWSYFSKESQNRPLLPGDNGDFTLAEGESLTFRYRVYVHTGDVKEAKVADRYADYAQPPVVRWSAK